ncbi:MAG: NAD(P)/FAD-dependent oxidoreductase [Chloroflexota bacterium]
MAKKHLLIGSGAAGLSALREIRSISGEDRIKMVTMENTLPYSPTALPYLLAGKIDESRIWTVNEDFFRATDSELAMGKRLIAIAPDRKEAIFDGGEREIYDTLLIATGSAPVLPAIEGIDTIPVLGFHTLGDYRELVARLQAGSEVLIYGGGLVAMGLASNLTKRGLKVKVVVRSRILRRYFDPVAGGLISGVFAAQGVEIITASVMRAGRAGEKVELLLAGGRTVQGDILVNCLGTVPRISFLSGSSIAAVEDGVLVDERMKTSAEAIYAAGDMAVAKDFFSRQEGPNAILPGAVEQGRIAGANMAGVARDYSGWISMNVFHFFGKGAAAIGLSDEAKGVEVLQAGSEKTGCYTKLHCRDGCLVGAQFVNIDVDPGVVLYLIKNKIPLDKVKTLLLEKPGVISRALMVKSERV